jgi:glycolate oxidase
VDGAGYRGRVAPRPFDAFAHVLRERVRPAQLISEPEQLRTYECDGLTGRRVVPGLVVLPETAAEVQAVVRACNEHGVPFVARGAGTGLSGGALPVADGIVISLARLTRILEVDVERGQVVVEPGVANLDVTKAVAAEGFYYAPDPSSQQVCTIGGNVAENSGGAHCLKYGFTVNHVLAADVVLPDGELVELSVWDEGPDLLGAFVGSEGTLGIATRLTLRILRVPETVSTLLAGFGHTDEAGEAVSGVIAAGILPAAVEMMDAITIAAAERAVNAGYPAGSGAVLIVELDGPQPQVEDDLARVEAICRDAGAREIRLATDAADRAAIWRGRKAAFAAMGRTSPDYYVQDGVVPRTRLPEVLRRIEELSGQYGLRVGNVFHAGDGNLHPLVLYDGRREGEAARAQELAEQILEACVDAGGSITGEHGVGTDKACSMPLMFGEDDLAAMARLRTAFDPRGLANPGKLFPTPRLCGEVPGPYRAHPLEKAGLAERF